jgi:hypothetical protein
MARLGSTIQTYSKIEFSSSNYYIQEDSGNSLVKFVAGGNRGLSLTSTGGTLHGVWSSDGTIQTSDRRLKENIKPLFETLQTNFISREGQNEQPVDLPPKQDNSTDTKSESADSKEAQSDTMNWLLRELRPVSYNLKTGAENKRVRFGFIADELEQVLPQVVRTKEDTPEKRKGVVYPDLIAVLTSMVQELNSQFKVMKSRMKIAEEELDRLDEEDPLPEDEEQEDLHL